VAAGRRPPLSAPGQPGRQAPDAARPGPGPGPVGGHDVALANRLRAGLGLAPSNSAIVAFRPPGAAERLARAGVRDAVRDGGVRVSCHLYNTPADVDAALDALDC
jgi:hypothetical protein